MVVLAEEVTMVAVREYSSGSVPLTKTRAHKVGKTLILAGILFILTPFKMSAATDVSGQVSVTQTGFGRNRATGVWTATMTVKNTSGVELPGPIQVVLTKLSSNATMVNKTGVVNGDPYITVSAETLAAGASASVSIQFMNPSNGFINFTPVTYSGGSW